MKKKKIHQEIHVFNLWFNRFPGAQPISFGAKQLREIEEEE